MRAKHLPVLETQKRALRDSGAALEAARPGATRDLLAALEHEPATRRAMTELQGASAPRLEAQLRTRAKELGIEPGAWLDQVMKEKNIERAISRGFDRGGYELDGPGTGLR